MEIHFYDVLDDRRAVVRQEDIGVWWWRDGNGRNDCNRSQIMNGEDKGLRQLEFSCNVINLIVIEKVLVDGQAVYSENAPAVNELDRAICRAVDAVERYANRADVEIQSVYDEVVNERGKIVPTRKVRAIVDLLDETIAVFKRLVAVELDKRAWDTETGSPHEEFINCQKRLLYAASVYMDTKYRSALRTPKYRYTPGHI